MSPRGRDIARCLLVVGFWAGAIVGVLTLFVWLASVATTPAKAQDGDRRDGRWVYRTIRQQYASCNEFTGECYRAWRYVRVRNYAYGLPEATRVYGYARREEWTGCREMRRVVGDQHLTIDGAKKAAGDAWAGAIRFHHGEKWMSLDNARDITYVCSRSSIKEGGVTTLGQTLNRCELSAIPCAPRREREERDR